MWRPDSIPANREDMISDESRLRDVNRLCLNCGLRLMQHGAESALVENVARRLGIALGAERIDVAIMANALTVSASADGRTDTIVGRNEDQGINMHLIIETQRLMLDVEAQRIDLAGAEARLQQMRAFHYPRWIVALAIGISCAAFARLAHADWLDCAVTLVASGAAMAVRQILGRLHFSPLINFFVTAFVATSVAAQGLIYQWGGNPKTAMAASCLLLVPGVPLINSVSDMVKGYINTGISRGTYAMLLALATCAGIVLAMGVWKVWAWL